MDFTQLDVFTQKAFSGNPLAVFTDASGLDASQMQAIASEMNLSETTFVTEVSSDRYSLRIFTPRNEMPFAGHPTIGTAWALHEAGALSGDRWIQSTPAGETEVWRDGRSVWMARTGEAEPDLEQTDEQAALMLAETLGLEPRDIEMEARELGRPGRLRPAFSDAGLRQLMIPLKDVSALASCRPRPDLLATIEGDGVYCFTAERPGLIRARGFFPEFGISEDPATGSAAAALGLYLADRVGPIDLRIAQGVEMGRPSEILVRSRPGHVEVGGSCALVLKGSLQQRP